MCVLCTQVAPGPAVAYVPQEDRAKCACDWRAVRCPGHDKCVYLGRVLIEFVKRALSYLGRAE